MMIRLFCNAERVNKSLCVPLTRSKALFVHLSFCPSIHMWFYVIYIDIGECVCVYVYPSKHIHVAVCGPIGTKFGTHMQIHLEKVVG